MNTICAPLLSRAVVFIKNQAEPSSVVHCHTRCSHFMGDVLTEDRVLFKTSEKLCSVLVMDRNTAANGRAMFCSMPFRSAVAARGAIHVCDLSHAFFTQRTSCAVRGL